jgi:hypothetical protein
MPSVLSEMPDLDVLDDSTLSSRCLIFSGCAARGAQAAGLRRLLRTARRREAPNWRGDEKGGAATAAPPPRAPRPAAQKKRARAAAA